MCALSRRSFVRSLALASAALSTPARALSTSAERTRLGLIGCGWYGGVNLETFLRLGNVEVVSLCDPNQRALQRTLATVASHQTAVPRTFADYRDMLAAGPHDIVIIATPDHWHALPAIAALEAGADLLLEKPISVDVLEGEAVLATARRQRRVVQVNTQRRGFPFYAKIRDQYLRSGRLGRIGRVETYSYLADGLTTTVPEQPVPDHLDYDLWTGPAPQRPFLAPKESRGWRNFIEYGNGPIGDLGVHMIDKARWLLHLGWPQRISCTGGRLIHRASSATVPDTQYAVFSYPEFDLTWEHRTWGASPIPQRHWSDQWGVRILGEGGTLNLTMYEAVFTPSDGGPREGRHLLSTTGDLENVDFSREAEVYSELNTLHVRDFLRAREAQTRPAADIEHGHISTACCVLANLALRLNRPLAYDPATRTVRGDDEATRLLARPYREPWVHPAAHL